MKKMKKWELLKKAYETYPAGTIARFKSAPRVEHISDGTFKITEDLDNGICVVNENDNACFYSSRDSHTGSEIEEWATPDEMQQLKKEFVMMSEDGVRLHIGDEFWSVSKPDWELENDTTIWEIKNTAGPHEMSTDCVVYIMPLSNKAFSTKEAAEKWIEEKNKPKVVKVDLKYEGNYVKVFKNSTSFYDSSGIKFCVEHQELERIMEAVKLFCS